MYFQNYTHQDKVFFFFKKKKAFIAPAKGNFQRSPLLLELQDLSLFSPRFQKQRLNILYVFTGCC